MSHKMNNIVQLGKDRTEKWDETSVIYKFNCDKCSSVYEAFHVNPPSAKFLARI